VFLTDKTIRCATPKPTPYKLSDGEGLYLLVQPTGSKLWRLKYNFGGRENIFSIGKYPFVSLAEAREHRYKAKKLLHANIDPNDQKREVRRSNLFDADNTFRAVAQGWFNTNQKKWVPKHADRVWRRLELHVIPTLGNRPILQIKTPELVLLVRKLNNKPEMASRIVRSLHAIFRYAVHCGIIEHNPAADLKGILIPQQVTHFAAIHPSGLPDLFAKLEMAKTTAQNKIAVKLLLHVFVRPGELRYGRWSEIDFEKKLWTIPPERMKKRRHHVVALSEPALALLRELQQITGYSAYLFPSQQRRRHPVMSENTINKILKNMGYGGKQVGHGFRAIASTVLNESGLFRSDVIEAQLAHVEDNNSRKPYNRAEYLEERTYMMHWWSDYLNAAHQQ
jgi:integrase